MPSYNSIVTQAVKVPHIQRNVRVEDFGASLATNSFLTRILYEIKGAQRLTGTLSTGSRNQVQLKTWNRIQQPGLIYCRDAGDDLLKVGAVAPGPTEGRRITRTG